MRHRLFCNLAPRLRASSRHTGVVIVAGLLIALALPPCAVAAGDAPAWMHALSGVSLPPHDEKTDAVLLYSEEDVTVVSADRVKTTVRKAYKILRPAGRDYGMVVATYNPQIKINNLKGWCMPAQGKDFEVRDKEAVEVSLPKVDGSELISDVKAKLLRIPAADPGNIIGYEYETDEQPMVLQDTWRFQGKVPAREAHYKLQLPPGWRYRALWLNYPEVKATESGNQLQWSLTGIKEITPEEQMPPMAGIAGQMVVSWFPESGAATNGFSNWQQMGVWYSNLTNGRREASPEIKQKVAALTAAATTPVAKMKAIAEFVQHDVRYVAIELGIGGWQPHSASETYSHHYGDCKDKATLMSSMLHEIGIDSYYVVINTQRGSVVADTPAHVGAFNHAILAIKLPIDVKDDSLLATIQDPRLGRLLFFDPTNDLTPFGQLGGYLQANYGLLVAPEGGELVQLPKQSCAMNSLQRNGKLTLDSTGTLKGDVRETRVGDRAASQRWALRSVTQDKERIQPIETLLSGSLANFQITHATVINLQHPDQPFGFDYSFVAHNYAKNAGDLLLVRPRVLGVKSTGLMETKDPRRYPVEFEGPARDTDVFEITLPAGYQVDELPEAVNADYDFASYHAKTEINGNVIRYTRTLEVKELSVPVVNADQLKKFYRTIASDERNMIVLKPATK